MSSPNPEKKLRIAMYLSSYVGPQNACIGLAQELRRCGHETYFITPREFAPKYQKHGFKTLELKSPDEDDQSFDPNKDSLKEFVELLKDSGLVDDLTPLEKIKKYKEMNFINDSFLNPALKYDQQIKEHLVKGEFSAILVDSEVFPPSLVYATDRPWFYLFCSNPIGFFQSPDLPPFCSDYSVDSDRSQWLPFDETMEKYFYSDARQAQKDLCVKLGYPPFHGEKFTYRSPYLNIYQFPKDLDYDDVIQIPPTFFGVDAFCRDEVEPFEIPEKIRSRMKPGDKLVYLSLGSMGSCKVDLMRRLVSVLSQTPHWYLVSKGKLHDQFELADNMWGDAYVPQAKILSMVDAAILHGGNNGFTEAMFNGVPVIIMPLFYDQFNNAARTVEKQVGFYLNPFQFKDQELKDAIDKLLFDPKYRTKTKQIQQNIQNRNSKQRLCEKIAEIVKKFDEEKNEKKFGLIK